MHHLLQMYAFYANNYYIALQAHRECMSGNSAFVSFTAAVSAVTHKPLEMLLIAPIQRIPRCELPPPCCDASVSGEPQRENPKGRTPKGEPPAAAQAARSPAGT